MSDSRIEGLDRLNREMRRLVEVPAKIVGELHREAAAYSSEKVIRATPVDTGRARSNWILSQDAPDPSVVEAADTSGATAISENKAAALRLQPFVVSYLVNNLPYATVLENGGYVPKNPEDSPEANKRRAASRNSRQQKRGRALSRAAGGGADSGKPFVRDGYSIQAPNGMLRGAFDATLNFVRLRAGRLRR